MAHAPTSESARSESLHSRPVFLTAGICLLLGLAVGYLLRNFETQPLAARASSSGPISRSPHTPTPQAPSLDQMKQMADQQAAPLLEKLKSDPHDSALLVQVGAIYHASHRFKEAAAYFDQAVQGDPKNLTLRNRLASSLYRSGDTDGAIAQLNQALAYDPHDANSLFNLGMIRLQGKGDGKGALAAWQRLLKSNPQLSAERKVEVQKLMADVLTTTSEGDKGAARK